MIKRSLCIALLIGAASLVPAAGQDSAPATPAEAPAAEPLVKVDTVVGTGKEAGIGSTVSVHYTGWLYKPLATKQHGRQFDSSVGQTPLEFVLGAGKVIKGWDQGVAGMKVGGKRTLIIPAELAYGKRAMGDLIPANAALIFDVELMDVK